MPEIWAVLEHNEYSEDLHSENSGEDDRAIIIGETRGYTSSVNKEGEV